MGEDEQGILLYLLQREFRHHIRCHPGIHRGPAGRIVCRNRIFAKISRPEVAERFMRPAPENILKRLVERGKLTAEEAELGRLIQEEEERRARESAERLAAQVAAAEAAAAQEASDNSSSSSGRSSR